jgi:hypothetical protein
MKRLSRRHFLKTAALATAAASALNTEALAVTKSLKKIGVQLFSIPKITEKDFAGTMQKLASVGFKEIEFYGPYSFSAEEDRNGGKLLCLQSALVAADFMVSLHHK